MCIIACVPKEKDLSKEYFRNCWINNPDWGGFSFTDETGKVVIVKGFEKLKSMEASYRLAKKSYDSPFMLHFRKVSRGKKTKENCHPFYTHDGKVAIAHNGTISNIPFTQTHEESDTKIFADMISRLDEKWYENIGICALIKNYIGKSRMAIMADNMIRLGALEDWKEVDGIYFSNLSYLEKKKEKPITQHHSGYGVYEFGEVAYDPTEYCSMCTKTYLLAESERKTGVCYSCQLTLRNQSNHHGPSEKKCAVCERNLTKAERETNSFLCTECYDQMKCGV